MSCGFIRSNRSGAFDPSSFAPSAQLQKRDLGTQGPAKRSSWGGMTASPAGLSLHVTLSDGMLTHRTHHNATPVSLYGQAWQQRLGAAHRSRQISFRSQPCWPSFAGPSGLGASKVTFMVDSRSGAATARPGMTLRWA